MTTEADQFVRDLQELRGFLAGVDTSSTAYVPAQLMPIFRTVIQYYRRERAREVEGARSTVVHRDLIGALEQQLDPFNTIIATDAFAATRPLRVPQATDFLTTERVAELQPVAGVPTLKYEDKFGVLLAPSILPAFLSVLRRSCELRRVPISVVFLDIDDFKRFNTRYGEPRVDRDLLPEFMRLVDRTIYGRGYAFRDGGDECVLLLPNTDLLLCCFILARLSEALADLAFLDIEGRVTISCGVCTLEPDSFLTEREARERAAKAKKRAKESGKNCIVAYVGDRFRDEDVAVFGPDGKARKDLAAA